MTGCHITEANKADEELLSQYQQRWPPTTKKKSLQIYLQKMLKTINLSLPLY